jgi:type I restriction enzyme M protein
VRLLTEVIEPYHGRILDPACGSGGMFVSSARFVAEHKKNPSAELSIRGVEKIDETGRLCRMVVVRKDLAVHGLEGDIHHGGQVNHRRKAFLAPNRTRGQLVTAMEKQHQR